MSKKIKILYLLGDIWSLGKNKGMPSIFKLLEKSDKAFDSTIFTTDINEYSEELPHSKIFYFKNNINYNFKNRYVLYLLNRVSNIILNVKYIYKYVQIQKKFDIIYCSSSVPIYAVFLLKFFIKTKTVHRIYGTFLYTNLNSKIDKIKKFEEVLSFKIKANKYIITDDGTYGDRVAQYFHIPKKKILFIRNGVDKIDFNDEAIINKYEINKNNFNCLCVSRLVGWKRVDRIINAFNKIKDNSVRLYVVGDGEELDTLKKLSINKNVIFLGALYSSEVHGLMKNLDCFISMYDVSNIGNPLLEALVYNLPIITYNSGNTKDIIKNGNGILIDEIEESKIINRLYNHILELKDDILVRNNLSENAKKYCKNNLYTWDERIDVEIDVIKQVCNEK